MSQYLDITRLRTYGGEGVLAKLFGIENQVLDRTRLQLKAWENKKEDPARVAEFQESIANLVRQSLLREFPDIN